MMKTCETLTCRRCGVTKLYAEFYPDRSARCGFDPRCRTCCAARAKDYALRNDERLRAAARAKRQQWTPEKRARETELQRQRQASKMGLEARMWHCAKTRASELGLPFTIEKADVQITERCPLLGVLLEKGRGKLGPNSPSLDRIRPELGYVKGNVWVVSHRANAIKQNATADELEQIARNLRAAYPVVPGLDDEDS